MLSRADEESLYFISLDAFELFLHLADEGAELADAQPVHELGGLVADDLDGLVDLFAAELDILLDNGGEVVDTVEEDVVDVVDGGIEVSGYGDVDDQQRAFAATDGLPEGGFCEEAVLAAGGGDYDVGFGEVAIEGFPFIGADAVCGGEVGCTLEGAVDDHDIGAPDVLEVFDEQLAHLASRR